MSHSAFHSDRLNEITLSKKLFQKGWHGKYFGLGDCVTFLTEDNQTIAEVHYDNRRSLILWVYWYL